MKKIAVTGGSGKAGTATIRELLEHGYEVTNLDVMQPKEWLCPFRQLDMTDYGQTFAALHGFDVVVHLAGDPRPDFNWFDGEHRFRNNTLSVYNVFNTAAALGFEIVVWASSETAHGFPFETTRPAYVPLDEDHPPQPTSSYAMSKVITEQMARHFNRWTGIPFIGLRFSNIMTLDMYEAFPTYWDDPQARRFNLWGYVDARDVALSIRLSLESDIKTAEAFNVCAADTLMTRTTRELVDEVFPGMEYKRELGDFEALFSIDKARKMLGYKPQHTWRDIVKTG